MQPCVDLLLRPSPIRIMGMLVQSDEAVRMNEVSVYLFVVVLCLAVCVCICARLFVCVCVCVRVGLRMYVGCTILFSAS